MKLPLKILWVKEETSTVGKGMEVLKNEYRVVLTFVEEVVAFQEALEHHEFDFIIIQLPILRVHKATILTMLERTLIPITCIVIRVTTNVDKINWIKAGVKDCLFENEIELLSIIIERQLVLNTQQARTKRKLKRKEIEYEALFYNSPEAILIHDFDKIIQVNAAFLFQLGYLDEEELTEKKTLTRIIHPEDITLLDLTD